MQLEISVRLLAAHDKAWERGISHYFSSPEIWMTHEESVELSHDGSERWVNLPDDATVHDRVVEHDDESCFSVIEWVESSLPVEDVRLRIESVHTAKKSGTVSWIFDFEPGDGDEQEARDSLTTFIEPTRQALILRFGDFYA